MRTSKPVTQASSIDEFDGESIKLSDGYSQESVSISSVGSSDSIIIYQQQQDDAEVDEEEPFFRNNRSVSSVFWNISFEDNKDIEMNDLDVSGIEVGNGMLNKELIDEEFEDRDDEDDSLFNIPIPLNMNDLHTEKEERKLKYNKQSMNTIQHIMESESDDDDNDSDEEDVFVVKQSRSDNDDDVVVDSDKSKSKSRIKSDILENGLDRIGALKDAWNSISNGNIIHSSGDDVFMSSPIMLLEEKLLDLIIDLLQCCFGDGDLYDYKERAKKILKDNELRRLTNSVYEAVYKQGKDYFNRKDKYYGKWHVYVSHGGKHQEKVAGWCENVFGKNALLNLFFDDPVLSTIKDGNKEPLDAALFAILSCDVGLSFINEDYFVDVKKTKWPLRAFYLMQTKFKFEPDFQNIPIFYEANKQRLDMLVGEVVNGLLPGIDEAHISLVFKNRYEFNNMGDAELHVSERFSRHHIEVNDVIISDGNGLYPLHHNTSIQFIRQNKEVALDSTGKNEYQEEKLIRAINEKLHNGKSSRPAFIKCEWHVEAAYFASLLMNCENISNEGKKWGWKWWVDCTTEDSMQNDLKDLCDALNIPNNIHFGKRMKHLSNFMTEYNKSKPFVIVFIGLNKKSIDANLFDFSLTTPKGSKLVIISNDKSIEPTFGKKGLDYEIVPIEAKLNSAYSSYRRALIAAKRRRKLLEEDASPFLVISAGVIALVTMIGTSVMIFSKR